MGLDIIIAPDNYEEVYTIDYFKPEKYLRSKMKLSRGFCSLMVKQQVSKGVPEFEQVAKITEASIDPILNMHDGAQNIDTVYRSITQLLENLSTISDLEKKIVHDGYDKTGIKYYFSDFHIDKGEGNMENNFGQDLRNFKRFLEYAKSKGTKTVSFEYGS